jgi:hypothetical protein
MISLYLPLKSTRTGRCTVSTLTASLNTQPIILSILILHMEVTRLMVLRSGPVLFQPVAVPACFPVVTTESCYADILFIGSGNWDTAIKHLVWDSRRALAFILPQILSLLDMRHGTIFKIDHDLSHLRHPSTFA